MQCDTARAWRCSWHCDFTFSCAPKGPVPSTGNHKQLCCKCCIPSDVCLPFHDTSPTRGIGCLLLYCWERWTRACRRPHRIVHCVGCSVKYTGGSVSQGQSWWPYLLYVWSQNPSAFVRKIPTATGFKLLHFTPKLTLYCWVRWPTSLHSAAGDMDVLAK